MAGRIKPVILPQPPAERLHAGGRVVVASLDDARPAQRQDENEMQ
jgi:hypothetical protein